MTRRIALLAVFALLLVACGGSAGPNGVATLEDAPVDPGADASADVPPDVEEALLAFAQCMRDNGVDFEDPTVDADGNLLLGPPRGGAGDVSRETIRTARQQCGDLLEGIALGFRENDQTELQDTLLEYAQCMRDNGYEMPDPDFSDFGGGGPGGGPLGGAIDPEDPAFVSADEACGSIRAAIGPGGLLRGAGNG